MISVCIATYNGAQYIRQQLLSILPQIGRGDEVVVSDDGSDDGTGDIVRSIADPRIRVTEGPHRHSPTLNFENALRHAKGDIIFLSDQDDVWTDDKVSVCTEALKTAGCVVSDAWVTDSRLNITLPSLYKMMRVRRGALSNLLWRNGYTGCCMAFRREVLADALPFPDNIPMHDIWIGNVAAFCHSVRFIDDKLMLFRRHGSVASCNGKGSKYSAWRKMMFRLHVAKDILILKAKKKTQQTKEQTQQTKEQTLQTKEKSG